MRRCRTTSHFRRHLLVSAAEKGPQESGVIQDDLGVSRVALQGFPLVGHHAVGKVCSPSEQVAYLQPENREGNTASTNAVEAQACLPALS